MPTRDSTIHGIEEALNDLFEYESEFAGLSLVRLEAPADLSPEGLILVVLQRAGSTFEKELPIGLAAAYLADEEAAVDGFNEWLHQLSA